MNSRLVRLPARLRNFGVLITLRIGRGGTRVIGRARVGATEHPNLARAWSRAFSLPQPGRLMKLYARQTLCRELC